MKRSRGSIRATCLLGAAVLATGHGRAQDVKLEDLLNSTIKSTTFRTQTVRRDGRKYPGKIRSVVEIIVGDRSDPVQFSQTTTWYGPTGRTHTTTMSGSGGWKTKANPYAGGGYGVGFMLDGTIYYIRTFKSGGFKFEFKLARTASGLTCTAREVMLKERGAGEIRAHSTLDNHPVAIVSSKQISSTCQVTKR